MKTLTGIRAPYLFGDMLNVFVNNNVLWVQCLEVITHKCSGLIQTGNMDE